MPCAPVLGNWIGTQEEGTDSGAGAGAQGWRGVGRVRGIGFISCDLQGEDPGLWRG